MKGQPLYMLPALLLASGCVDTGSGEGYSTNERSTVRIAEVLAEPSSPTGAFIELRNDGNLARPVEGLRLSFDRAPATKLKQRTIAGSVADEKIAANGMALVVDKGMPEDELA